MAANRNVQNNIKFTGAEVLELRRGVMETLETQVLKFATGCVMAVQRGKKKEAARCAEVASAFGVAWQRVRNIFEGRDGSDYGR